MNVKKHKVKIAFCSLIILIGLIPFATLITKSSEIKVKTSEAELLKILGTRHLIIK